MVESSDGIFSKDGSDGIDCVMEEQSAIATPGSSAAELNADGTVKQPEEMTVQERSAFATRCKEIGNRGFKAGDWAYSALAYEEGLRYLQYEPGKEGVPDSKFDHGGADRLENDMRLVLSFFLNLAAVMLKVGEDRRAEKFCSQAIAFDADNIKAHFRRAQALLAQGDYEGALRDVARVLELDPTNREVAAVQRSAEAGLRNAVQQEKAMFAKMLG
mmetsp:Transcript_28663/g.72647  ORF Transcript_28663/g.72647 Transcript_28663/m.72647 type:complete len:216 (-) Transcript_28663:87-734(-)|eukprot:CAMPEP_0183391526 /NCGR_PEP_ID=MMETSP0370-20130417/6474_1 /TAXON_ID=268820 /ORGANISM="Peridinium aciculiferum, Strain PAER-2" /LENGTH=215 /DNA_ID=CAMNT_0025571255 /DNA_START=59 /DNA_END=706 /DNA_ORIENTATION=+